jgi:hypothetical protein
VLIKPNLVLDFNAKGHSLEAIVTHAAVLRPIIDYVLRLLLDSRVVDEPMAYNPTFVILSSLKPLIFNSLKNELRFSDNAGA